MSANTFTVRLIDMQPVSVTNPDTEQHTFDVHQDIVIKGKFMIDYNDRTGAAYPSLNIIFPDETIESLKTLLGADTITPSASVAENNSIMIEFSGA